MKRTWGILPRGQRVVAFAVFFATAAHVASGEAGWTEHARRLTGESWAVRNQAIASLRKTPNLAKELEAALATGDRFLAFDAIVALDLKAAIPALLAYAATDESGYAYHVLNSLAGPKERAKVFGIYERNLATASPAAKVAIIDAFARTSRELSADRLDALLADEMPEVRSAALGYVRSAVLRHGRREEARRVFSALLDPAFQNRLQALYLVSELPSALRPRRVLRAALERCGADPVEAVRTYCRELSEKTGRE